MTTQIKKTDYFGELSFTVKVSSELEYEEFKSLFSDDGLRAILNLKTVDGKDTDAEVLLTNEVEWSHPDEL